MTWGWGWGWDEGEVGRLKREGLYVYLGLIRGFPGGSVVKNLPAKQETRLQSLVWKDPLEKEMATAVFLLGKPRGLEGDSPWGCKESDATE